MSSSAPSSASTKPPAPATLKKQVSYEAFAPRSSDQIARLHKIQALCAGPMATGNEDQKEQEKLFTLAEAMSPPTETDDGSLANLALTTSSASKAVQETMERTYKACDHLTSVLKHSSSLRLALRASINICEDISNRHAELLRHSGELSAAADRLQAEEAQLTQHAKEIGLPLQHYDAVDRIGILVGVLFRGKSTVRGLAKIKVDHDEYPEVLQEIDDAVEFFGRECGGRQALEAAQKRHDVILSGSMEYYRRSLALQEAALFLIQEAVVDRITQTATDITNALNLNKEPVGADKLEASLIYTRFHGISARSNRLILLIKKRKGDAYHELLQLCRNTYCVSREGLLKLTVRAHMDKLKDEHGLVGMTRIASVFLIRLCTVETQLYLDFFGDSGQQDANDSEFQSYLNALCQALHRTVRRGLVTVHELDTLCQIVSVLREERGQASSSPTTMAAARAIASVIEDAQERLIFCANSALQKQVIRFRPTSADLDYPAKLQQQQSADRDDADDDAVQKQMQVYESWFPPMRSVLKVLSKIFRVVEPRVFEDIARECVQACTRCLKEGASVILARSGVMHADLFLVKHLLILREQLSPFDIELRAVERQLDFSDAGKAVSRFLANRNRRLFSMSTENALITLLREGVSVHESAVDSKRDLEDSLRSACNDFIEHTSQSLARDIFSFDQQCKSVQGAEGNLGELAFTNAESVKAMLDKASGTFESQLDHILGDMSLYLDNPATQSILLKPVSRKIARAFDEARVYIEKIKDGENDWTPELRSEVMAKIEKLENAMKAAAKTSK